MQTRFVKDIQPRSLLYTLHPHTSFGNINLILFEPCTQPSLVPTALGTQPYTLTYRLNLSPQPSYLSIFHSELYLCLGTASSTY